MTDKSCYSTEQSALSIPAHSCGAVTPTPGGLPICTPTTFDGLPAQQFNAQWYASHAAVALDTFLSSLHTLEQQVYGHPEPPKIHDHQKKFGVAKHIPEAYKVLSTVDFSNHADDFETLYTFIKDTLKDVKGLGNLAYYDMALRIGWNLPRRVTPRAYVYLHSGAKTGAKLILGADRLSWRVPVEVLTSCHKTGPLKEPRHLEDFCCLWHIKNSNKKKTKTENKLTDR